MCKGPVVERNTAHLSKHTIWPREVTSCKVSQAIVSCGNDEKPLMIFKWKGCDQLYLIKDHFIHTVRIGLGKSVGNPGEN